MSERRDAVVVGSGAGGSVMALELARRGLEVTVVEAGARWDPATFEHDELAMFVRAYKHSGLQGTKDHDSLIVQGFTVGGSTVINNAIFLRADLDRVLTDWAEAGAPVERAPLEAAYEELEHALHVEAMPPELANGGAKVFLDGCAASRDPGRAAATTTATPASAAAGATTAAATTARPRCSSPTSRGPRRAGRRCSTAAKTPR